MISVDVRNCISLVGQRLVVFDVVFLVVGLPSIVFARLGFQDLVFGVLTSMLSFIARERLHSLMISFRLSFPLYSRISLQLSSHLWWLSLSPRLPLGCAELVSWTFGPFYPELCALSIYLPASWWLWPFDYYSPSCPFSWVFLLVL
ncbi:hypothetical protein F2Q69_00042210 [Brassica cretica]|uniref:Uncharacterized protein n=1 Tax=Brassica cretica TaxID=69181 RepID=A0A8S9NPR0_BRACR|nr:hypothetical protein F2Q69_00042210 [Brassica cretica]